MIRRLVAYLLVLVIFFTSIIQPAHASTMDSAFSNSTSFEPAYEININSEYRNRVIDPFIEDLLQFARGLVAGAVLCYTIDGIATTVFPPAGALLPFCPAIGSFSEGSIKKFEKVIIH